jgi:thiamine pyrophosphate-dependent acetolactate synthase large subunit-like protein
LSQTVANVLVGVLEQIGVRHVFGLIGDSLNPLADAVRRSNLEWIGVRHEEGAALAASGQAKLRPRPEISESVECFFFAEVGFPRDSLYDIRFG